MRSYSSSGSDESLEKTLFKARVIGKKNRTEGLSSKPWQRMGATRTGRRWAMIRLSDRSAPTALVTVDGSMWDTPAHG
jgi:hypothetical protein